MLKSLGFKTLPKLHVSNFELSGYLVLEWFQNLTKTYHIETYEVIRLLGFAYWVIGWFSFETYVKPNMTKIGYSVLGFWASSKPFTLRPKNEGGRVLGFRKCSRFLILSEADFGRFLKDLAWNRDGKWWKRSIKLCAEVD